MCQRTEASDPPVTPVRRSVALRLRLPLLLLGLFLVALPVRAIVNSAATAFPDRRALVSPPLGGCCMLAFRLF